MDTIAPLNVSDALDFVAKFHRVMEKAGVDRSKFQLPINNRTARRNLAEYLNMGCPKVKGGLVIPANDYDLARTILGKDFITPEEIAAARGLTYSEEQLRHFADTLPSEEVLQWLRDNGCMLVAGPPSPMSLLEVRSLKKKLFYSETGGWYADESQKFSREDKVGSEWLMLRKTPVANSTSKMWSEQQELISEVEYVPNVAEATWGLTTYKEVRGEYLLPSIYVRTSSVDRGGDRVGVGSFGSDGPVVDSYSDAYRNGGLGVSSARKRN
ncbi:MAG: hypothetical protein WC643_00265 [Parcubacteria group bacterium]|jgi:hypothetical protein